MLKKSVVRLTDAARIQLRDVIGKLKGSSRKVRRAQCSSRRMWTVRGGPIERSGKRSIVAYRRSKACGSVWSSRASTTRSTE